LKIKATILLVAFLCFSNNMVGVIKMNILNIELTRIEGTKLGFKVDDKELLDYLVSTWKCRDLVNHSIQMHEMEIKGKI
jgi:hypothetical protein